MRTRGVAALSLWIGVTVACGGRSGLLPSEQEGGASARGGRGGASSGGSGFSLGGLINVGGMVQLVLSGSAATAAAGSCACDPIACPPGYVQGYDPQNCCGGPCELDCSDTGCPDIELDCGPGMHVETPPEECCPSCVSDQPPPCEQAQMLYRDFREVQLFKYIPRSCEPQGCESFTENNRCTIDRQRARKVQRLRSWRTKHASKHNRTPFLRPRNWINFTN